MFFGDYYIKLEHAFFNPDNEIFKSRTALLIGKQQAVKKRINYSMTNEYDQYIKEND
jgi:hypothetical protein